MQLLFQFFNFLFTFFLFLLVIIIVLLFSLEIGVRILLNLFISLAKLVFQVIIHLISNFDFLYCFLLLYILFMECFFQTLILDLESFQFLLYFIEVLTVVFFRFSSFWAQILDFLVILERKIVFIFGWFPGLS